jgi:hypothetical protein
MTPINGKAKTHASRDCTTRYGTVIFGVPLIVSIDLIAFT